MATCKEITELLDLYLDGELDKAQNAIVAEHLEKCSFCKSIMEKRINEREIIQRSFPVPELRSYFKESIMSQLALKKQQSGRPFSWFLSFRPPLVAALAGCLLIAGIFSIFLISAQSKEDIQISRLNDRENYSKDKENIKINENEDIIIGGNIEQVLIDEDVKDVMKTSNVDSQARNQTLEDNSQQSFRSETAFKGILPGRMQEKELDDEHINELDLACAEENYCQNISVGFSFAYLPCGFKLEKLLAYSLETSEKHPAVNLVNGASIYCGGEPLLLTFYNQDTEERFYIGIFPLGQPENINPQELFFSIFSEDQVEEIAGQWPFIWYMEKGGKHFLFGVIGNVDCRELEMVAASSY